MDLFGPLSWFITVMIDDLKYLVTWFVDWLYQLVAPWIQQLWASANLPELPTVNWNLLNDYVARANYWVPLDSAWSALKTYLNWRLVLIGIRIVVNVVRGM